MTASGTADGAGGHNNLDLLARTSLSFREICRVLKNNKETNKKLRNLYNRWEAYCIIAWDHTARIRSVVDPNDELIIGILNEFESAVARDAYTPSTSRYSRLQQLNQRWACRRNQDNHSELELARRCLDFGPSPELADEDKFTEALSAWEEAVVVRFPEDPSQWSAEDLPPQKKRRTEPSYAVGSAARSLFEALMASAKCDCHPMQELGAKLSLGTYRKPSLDDDDADDFYMFLASQQHLQEVHVQAIRDVKPAVRFALNDEVKPPSRGKLRYKPTEVKRLCDQMERLKMASKRLELQFDKGRLWKLRSATSSSHIDQTKPPVSLQHFIRDGPRSFTEKTKRILAVLLGYAILHLHGTPWLQPTWDSSSILFFQTSSSKIPLKPFIQTPLSACTRAQERDEDGSDDGGSEGPDPDDIDPDDMDPDDVILHQFPILVPLAAMLMELYSATPFEMLASRYDVKGSVSRTNSTDVDLVFKGFKNDTLENSKFNYAIEKCLDPSTWEDESYQELDDQTLMGVLYEEVVRPLEDELCDAFQTISIDELDKIAEDIDFGNWGSQTIQNQQHGRSTEATGFHAVTAAIEARPSQPHYSTQLRLPLESSLAQAGRDSLRVSPHPWARPEALEIDYLAARFFDGEAVSEVDQRRAEYSDWKKKVMDVYATFIGENDTLSPVKIAVLDTGIDKNHPNLFAREDQIIEKYNWTNESRKKAVGDRNGHGTFVANLLLDYAPGAQLCVAKIAEDTTPSPPELVAKAINHAVDVWNVDIISMSFGYPTDQLKGYDLLDKAILNAYSKKVLVFAAASNDGANTDRAHPARNQNVICIHSTDAQGNRSRFSPTALTDDKNIATIGQAIESAWPTNLCNVATNPMRMEWKSGTSYSTPIAVGIATFLIQYARLYLPGKADRLKTQMNMKNVFVRIAQREQSSERRDGYNYMALSRHPDTFFGKSKTWIDETLAGLL